jgi:hypothetical protein
MKAKLITDILITDYCHNHPKATELAPSRSISQLIVSGLNRHILVEPRFR